MTNSIVQHAFSAVSYGIATTATAINPIVGAIAYGTHLLSSFASQKTLLLLKNPNSSREEQRSTLKKTLLIATPLSVAFTHGTLAISGFSIPLLSTFSLVATASASMFVFNAIRLPECSAKNILKIHTAAIALLTAGLFLSGGAPSLGAAFVLSSSISFTAFYIQRVADAYLPEMLPRFLKL